MLQNTSGFEVPPSDRISESRSHGSLRFDSSWHPTSPKMHELMARHQAQTQTISQTPVKTAHKV